MSLPLGSSLLPSLHVSIPTNGPPEVRYRHLMEIAQAFQGMALSVHPSLTPSAPEVPLHPAPALQAFSTTLPPRPLPQLLTAPMMGAQLPPPTFAQHTAQHIPLPPSG